MTARRAAPAEATEAAQLTPQQVVNEGISRVIAATGIDSQKSRYKAMRAIAWQAFMESIKAGDFEGLVKRATANVHALPSGWEVEVAARKANR